MLYIEVCYGCPGIITRPKPAERREACWPMAGALCSAAALSSYIINGQVPGQAWGDERLGRWRLMTKVKA